MRNLKENAEFKYAKDQRVICFRAAWPAPPAHGRPDDVESRTTCRSRIRAAYGSRLILKDLQKSREIEYKLVTTEEADASKGLISTTSPIGKALMGKRAGDEVTVITPAGTKEFEVINLKTIYEEE